MRHALSITALAIASLAFVPVAAAQATTTTEATADSTAEARRLFEQGMINASAERWGEALEFFRRSAAILERPTTVFNIGTALLRLGRVNEAIVTLQHFLDVGTDATQRDDATRMLGEARSAIVHLAIHLAPADATIHIDGLAVEGSGEERTLSLDPGRHVVEVVRAGYESHREDIATLPGEALARAVSLTEIAVITTLTIAPSVPAAVIELDGATVEAETAVVVSPGDHVVRVTADGFTPFERTMTVARGETLRVEAQLEHPGGPGLLEDPIFWTVTGIVAAGLIAGAIAIGIVATQEPDPYRGTTGVVVHALSF